MNTLIQTPTNKLENSLDFYTRLGFRKVPDSTAHLVSDGQCLIEINPDRYARAGIKLYKTTWEKEMDRLNAITNVHAIEGGFLLSDPSGVRIYLLHDAPELKIDLSDFPPSILGNYAGLSLESTDIKKSVAIWELLGFSKSMGAIDQGWISYTNQDGMTVSFMAPNTCPHLFFNPSLTYFNGTKNLEIIQKIRDAGIPITEEITHFNKEGIVDNIIIRDPGGYGFFVFND